MYMYMLRIYMLLYMYMLRIYMLLFGALWGVYGAGKVYVTYIYVTSLPARTRKERATHCPTQHSNGV